MVNFFLRYLGIVLSLIVLGGCAALIDEKSYISAFNTPTYLFDSGILKLEHTLTMPSGDGAEEMFFSHNGRYLVTNHTYSVHFNVWDMETGELRYQIDKYSKGFRKILGPKRILSNIFMYGMEAMFLPDDSALLLPKRKKGVPSNVSNIAPISEGYYPDANYSYFYLDMDNPDIMRPALPESMAEPLFPTGCFSPDGKYYAQTGKTTTQLAILNNPAYAKRPFLKLYRTSDWKLVADVKKGFASNIIRFTPDSKYVVDYERVGDDGGNQLVSAVLSDGREIKEAVKKDDYMDNLEKYEYPEIRFWSVPDLKLEKTIDNVFRGDSSRSERYPDYLSISQDGKMVAVNGTDIERTETKYLKLKNYIKIFSIVSGGLVHELKDDLGSVDFSRNNQYLVIANSLEETAVTVYSTKDWQVKERVQFRKNAIALNHARTFNTRKNLFAYGNGNIIYIWKVIEN